MSKPLKREIKLQKDFEKNTKQSFHKALPECIQRKF